MKCTVGWSKEVIAHPASLYLFFEYDWRIPPRHQGPSEMRLGGIGECLEL
jgi:hypothetical protein